MRYSVIFLLVLSCFSINSGLKLLMVFPTPSKSHYTLGNELGKGLAKAGHEVTMISCFAEKNPPKYYKDIVLSDFLDIKVNNKSLGGSHVYKDVPPIFQLLFLTHLNSIISDRFFEHRKIQKLLKSDEHFDAVIIEQVFNDALKIMAYRFRAHLILFSTVVVNRWTNDLVRNPEPPSYVPNLLLGFNGNMNFYQRTYNFLFGILSDLHLYLLAYPKQEAIMKKYFPNAPDFNELLLNVSLILVNSHESTSYPVPHVPNMIGIGGFHVNTPKELPKDLNEFMNNATDGVIYFSMGSTLIPSEMPKEKKDAILKVLGARKEQVLWKWDEDTLENKPINVMTSKWFPQQSILAHPNCKLFISHGGLLSTIETVYFGVPVLAIPIVYDQRLNAARSESLGFTKIVPLSELDEHNFADRINELVNNPSFRENAQVRSRIMNDRPVKPMDLAVYWVEYVVRHNGAPHLRVAGTNLPLYKYYMLDVIGALLAALALWLYVLFKICRRICGSKKSRQNESIPKSKKKGD